MSHKSISGVRIVLDLQLFFNDKRRKCYHYIDFSRNKIVRDVCNDIKSNFDINTDIFLEINKCYVPEKQDVRIFYDEDVVRAIDAGRCVLTIQNDTFHGQRHVSRDPEILTNTLSDQKSETVHNQAGNESSENIIVSKPKKRKKTRTDETQEKEVLKEGDVDEGEKPKRKKKSMKNLPNSIPTEHEKCSHSKSEREPDALSNSTVVHSNVTCKDESTVICDDNKAEPVFTIKPMERTVGNVYNSTEELLHEQTCKVDSEGGLSVSSAIVKENINDGVKQDILLNSEGHAEKSEHLDNSSCKKRRRRKRQKSPRINQNLSEQQVMEFPVQARSSLKTPQHIKFVDEEEEEEEQDSSNNTKPNMCGYNALDRESEASATDNRSSTKNEYNVKSDFDVLINGNANERNSDNFVIQTGTSPMIFECKRTNKMLNNQTVSIETETDFSKYPVIQSDAPRVNDIIAFKKLKMDSDYCPSISKYISAKVLQVSENDILMLRILNGHEELKEPKGKFSLEEENEVDDFEEKIVNDIVEMNRAEILEIRLLFP